MSEREVRPTPRKETTGDPGHVRSLIVVVLLILVGVSSIVASVGVWAERAVYDEDGFVSSVDAVFDEEAVQQEIALRLADATYELIGVDDLLTSVLVRLDDLLEGAAEAVRERAENVDAVEVESTRDGPSLTILAGPLSNAVRELLFEASLSVIRSQPFKEIRDGALRLVHRQVTAIIDESDDAGLRREGGQVILDLAGVIERVIIAVAGEDGAQFLESLEIPDDVGEFVVQEEGDYSWLWNLVSATSDYTLILVGITPVLLALAISISPNRRGTIVVADLTAALSATLLIFALPAAREIAANWVLDAKSESAARAAFNVWVVRNLEIQSVIVIVGGLAVAAGGALTGDSELAAALRASLRPRRDRGDAVGLTGGASPPGQCATAVGAGYHQRVTCRMAGSDHSSPRDNARAVRRVPADHHRGDERRGVGSRDTRRNRRVMGSIPTRSGAPHRHGGRFGPRLDSGPRRLVPKPGNPSGWGRPGVLALAQLRGCDRRDRGHAGLPGCAGSHHQPLIAPITGCARPPTRRVRAEPCRPSAACRSGGRQPHRASTSARTNIR